MGDRILIYLDQNIISSIRKGEIVLKPSTSELVWTYSNEHFNEIHRSDDWKDYLDVINDIKASHLKTNLDKSFKIMDSAQLDANTPVFDLYESFLSCKKGFPDTQISKMDPVIAWVNGGGSQELLEEVPDNIAKELYELTSGLSDFGLDISPLIDHTKEELSRTVNKMIGEDNNILKTREALGVGKGALGNLNCPNALESIWMMISDKLPGIEMDQFFSFEPHPLLKQGYETWPVYLGISGCCAVLDILGYQAEKKIRKIEQIPNIRSDAGHIAMASFCNILLSNDSKLRNRAQAIYEYKNLHTVVGKIEVTKG